MRFLEADCKQPLAEISDQQHLKRLNFSLVTNQCKVFIQCKINVTLCSRILEKILTEEMTVRKTN